MRKSNCFKENTFWWTLLVVNVGIIGYAIYLYSTSSKEEARLQNSTWDILLFVQQWPFTYCAQWEEKAENHTCQLPSDNSLWTIHGIWPTKIGTIGPEYCKPSLPFNKTALDPILSNLTTYWLTIQKGEDVYKFWKHEWKKHGSCAAEINSLNTELKYFIQGLDWLQTYNVRDMFLDAGIYPSTNFTGIYNVTDYWKAITSKINKNPYIECIKDQATKEFFISEVYLCFGKDLELVDCDNVKYKETKTLEDAVVTTNCPLDTPVIFADVTPKLSIR